jgi:23S rRNA (adenine2503-C2)-methyltransferase
MFSGNALPLVGIYDIVKKLPAPVGRKITLNFAVADYTVDPAVLLDTFDPAKFLVKLTPMHKTKTAISNSIFTRGQITASYPYEQLEEQLKKAGYEVIVFVASLEEDMSRITCGNAILAGTVPEVPYREIDPNDVA